MPALPLTGGCLCGGVRYEINEPPVSASYCHCTRCRRRTGTAASAGSVCGSALWSRSPTEAGVVSVRLGTFDADPGIRPQYRQFVADAASWEQLPGEGLPRYDERPPA